jgi:hypothetical protein
MPWNLIDHPGPLRWSKIKGKKGSNRAKGYLSSRVSISGGLYPLRVGRRQYINLKIAVGEWNIKKNVTNSAKDRPNLQEFDKQKTIIYFQWFRSYIFFNEAM